jgi:hypothetical protein
MAAGHSIAAVEQAFLDQVIFLRATGCWAWTGSAYGGRDFHRSGGFQVAGKTWQAHRFAYVLFNGPIPEGLCVLHRCDFPLCVNPTHLFLGTVGANNVDRTCKNRSARGGRNGSAKLTEEQVRAVRAASAAGKSARRIAKEHEIPCTTVRNILHRRTWKHVP